MRHDPPLLLGTDGAAIPELAISVTPQMRGLGIGGVLLDHLARRCTGSFEALSLNVHQRNPSICMNARLPADGPRPRHHGYRHAQDIGSVSARARKQPMPDNAELANRHPCA
jgi:GNAT superfamily N-acetyltransferase